jgi:CRP/FNR family cyclic AMP-dependent transcriptional regulator
MNGAQRPVNEIIETSSIFNGLTEAQIRKLGDFAVRKAYSKPVCLLECDGFWESLYFIESGFISAALSMDDGREMGGFPVREGNWVYLTGILAPEPASFEVWTGKNTEFVVIPATIIRSIAEENPVLYKNALAQLNRLMRLAHFHNWISTMPDGPQKVARQLHLINSMTDPTRRGSLPLSQECIAKSLGMSRQTLSRHIKKLNALGLIDVGYGRIDIIDYSKLETYWELNG